MDPTLFQKIDSYEERGARLQKDAKYKQSLDVYEQLLQITRGAFGESSDEFDRTSIKICELCNLIAMILLQKEKYDLCLLFLRKAEAHCTREPKYTAITYNNYACYCRKTGKLRTALTHLQNALELQWRSKKEDTLADTYLNLCAVLSQLGKHKQALQNVLFSVTILQEELLTTDKVLSERAPVLAIAYHNMGVELQHLERYDESISTYEKALRFGEKHLGEDNSLLDKLRAVLKNAEEARNEKRAADMGRTVKDGRKIQKMRSLYRENKEQKEHKEHKEHRERPFTANKK